MHGFVLWERVSTPRQQQGGLSITTLSIASAASVAAAIVVHEIWQGGAILGAAITPVIVAIVSESLKRPVERVTAIREEKWARTQVRVPAGRSGPPPPELERPDPFGIWQAERQPWYRRLDRRHLRLALITGLVAFLIGALVLTVTELVFGGNVGTGGSNTTVFGGGSKKKSASDEEKTSTTQTETQEEEAPAETAPTAPSDEVPTDTAPTTPEEATPPAEEAPAPETPQTVPAPAPVDPGATAPAPAPTP